MTHVLVTYATKHHATEEIAHAIADVLKRDSTLHVHVWPAHEVTSIKPYSAVIVGSAVYMGQWQAEAVEFLNVYEDDLKRRPTWIFSSGPTGKDASAALSEWNLPDSILPVVDRINPRDARLFHGRLEPSQLNVLERAFIKVINVPTGDYRDWESIHIWAEGIRDSLTHELVHPAEVMLVP